MAIDVGSAAVVGRSIDPATDVAIGVTPSGSQASGLKADVWAALFKTLLTGHFPSDLTNDQKISLREAIGSGAISGVQYLDITNYDSWPAITRQKDTLLEQIVIGKIGGTNSFTFNDAGNNEVTQSGGETWIALGGNRWARLVFAPQVFPNAFISLRVVSVASAAQVQALGTDQGGNNFSFEDNDTIYFLKPSADFSVTFNTRVLAMKSGETWVGPDGFGAFSRIDVPGGVAGGSVPVNYHTPTDSTEFNAIQTTGNGIHIMSPAADFTVSSRDYKNNNIYIYENTRSRWLEIEEATENLSFLETLEVRDIGSATALDNLAGGEIPPTNRPTIIRITADFTKTIGVFGYQFKSGEVWISSLGTSWQRIVVPGGTPTTSTPQSIGRIDVNPGRIEKATDLDGTYQCILSLTDAESALLKAAGVNYLEIWFGSETVHVVSPWSPSLVTRINAVVDTTEETSIGSVGSVLSVRAIYRINKSGSQTYYAEGSGALRVGGFDSTAAGDDLQSLTVNSLSSFNSALTAQETADTPLEIVFAQQIVITSGPNAGTYEVGDVVFIAPRSTSIEHRFNTVTHAEVRVETAERRQGDEWTPYSAATEAILGTALTTHGGSDEVHGALITITGAFTTSTRAYAVGQRYYLSPYHRTEADMLLMSEASGVPTLTQAQQIALLSFVADPGSISFSSVDDLSGKVRSIRISIQNPELLTGDVWVQGWIQGQPGTGARTKWASNISAQTITVSELTADAIATALIAGSEGHLEVRLHFYDAESAGNEIERIGVNVPLNDQRNIPKSIRIIQAAVDVTGANPGVASVTLPSDYQDYHHISLAVVRNNFIVHSEFETDVLAIQSGNRSLGLPAAGNNNPRLSWNPTTRVLSGIQERIVYLELAD